MNESLKIGPSPSGDDEIYLKDPVLKHMRKCVKYINSLSDFSQYCVWRYTIGSASINSYLIFGQASANSRYWVYLFFAYYRNTFPKGGEREELPKMFTRYKALFDTPERFSSLPFDVQMKVAEDVIQKYIDILQTIILNCPAVKQPFNVYKVSSYYPGLPSVNPIEFKPSIVLQLPFNSTTISPNFNFAPFINSESDCCFFVISVPTGSRVLYVDYELHAYPFEKEVFLPHGCGFNIFSVKTEVLNYIDPTEVNMEILQNPGPKPGGIEMGNVYDINEYLPCKYAQGCVIKNKPFNVFRCEYISPEDM